MFAAISIAALALAGVMTVAGPPSTFDPVAAAAQENTNVEYVAQQTDAEQSKLQLVGAKAPRGRGDNACVGKLYRAPRVARLRFDRRPVEEVLARNTRRPAVALTDAVLAIAPDDAADSGNRTRAQQERKLLHRRFES